MLMVNVCFGMFITGNQLAIVISEISLDWPEAVRMLFKIIQIFALNLEVLPFACVGNSDEGLQRFLMLMCVIPAVFGWLLLASLVTRAMFPEGHAFRMEWPETLNTFGMLYQVLFVVIVVWMAQPFRTFAHPFDANKRSLVHYPDVVDGSEEHVTMLTISVICFVCFVLSFLVFYIRQLKNMPSLSLEDLSRRTFIYRAYRFMFMRFRPSAWYWGGVLLFRNFLFGISCGLLTLGSDQSGFECVNFVLVFSILWGAGYYQFSGLNI